MRVLVLFLKLSDAGTNMGDYANHMQELVQDFIGTVLFVDDRLTPNNTPEAGGEEQAAPIGDALIGAVELEVPIIPQADPHVLRIKELSDSCSSLGILCSLVNTDAISDAGQQTALAEKIVKLSRKADVIVLDWELEQQGSGIDKGATATCIIDKLKSDNKDRLVLVCIFSAEPERNINIKNLGGDHVKVIFVSKTAVNAYEELPSKMCKIFSEMHFGLLPAAAMSALQIIRDNTHRLLSQYSSGNDAAYLSHHCWLGHPGDAEVFITELLAASFSDLIRGNENVMKSVNIDTLGKWLESKKTSLKDIELKIPGISKRKINHKIRQQWLQKGVSSWLKEECNKKKNGKELKRKLKQWETSHSISLISYFDNIVDKDKILKKEADFARFGSHVLFDKPDKNPNSCFLTLGSIIKKKGSNKYFLCLQPVCDSVRLNNEKNKFIFISLGKCEKCNDIRAGFHIIVHDKSDVFLKVSEKTSQLKIFEFVPETLTGKVVVRTNDDINGFENNLATQFTMLAQLRNEQARRIATRFLHDITRVGLNESEWLRRHGTT